MLEEWYKSWFERYCSPKNHHTPDDDVRYLISKDVIAYTQGILEDYGNMTPSHEGFVYWAGTKEQNSVLINAVIAPKTQSNFGSVIVSHESNIDLVLCLSNNKLVHFGQVHSHPGSWVDHSEGDNLMAPFKSEGLISIVVRHYALKGVLPLTKCGIHRYSTNRFIRLSNKYIRSHFSIIKSEARLFDLRDK